MYSRGTISGIMNTFGALSGAIIPTAVGYLTKNSQTMQEWSIIFYFSAALCTVAGIIFIILGSSEKQPWNNPPEESMSPEGPRVSYVASSNKAGLQPNKWEDVLLQESSDDIDLSTYPGKAKMFDDRPWRTDSFPDLRDDDEPSVVLKK